MSAPYEQPSRLTALTIRFAQSIERLEETLNPFSPSPDHLLKPWAMVALAIVLVTAAAGMAFGLKWVIDHHNWKQIIPLLKVGKWFAIGFAVIAIAFIRGPLLRLSLVQRLRTWGAEPTSK
jgi:hypothetical protein